MRGSVYYQTAQLIKCIFKERTKKSNRVDPTSNEFGMIASYTTAKTYRNIWNNFGRFVLDEYGIKDFEGITSEHVESYMLSKIDISPSKQYLEKISSALGKLEIAIIIIREKYNKPYKAYDFSIRQKVLDMLRKEDLVYDGYHNRTYQDVSQLILLLSSRRHQLAANIQLHSGTRFEGISLVTREQELRKSIDPITKQVIYKLETKEKGGKVGFIYLAPTQYFELRLCIIMDGYFKLDYQSYIKDIRRACKLMGIQSEGSHGFRWNFAERRVREYQENGHSYFEALQGVSNEMKHNRITISEHYIGV